MQQPIAMSIFEEVMGVPAWKTLPSWYLVATDDQAIPPDAERLFASRMGATTVEIPSSHVPMISHPGDVAQLIKTAAEAVPTGGAGVALPAGSCNLIVVCIFFAMSLPRLLSLNR